MREIVKEMYGEEKAKALAKIPISNDTVTVKRRISSNSDDITVQCTARLRDNDFAIQLDVSKMLHLLVCVRCEWEEEIKRTFLERAKDDYNGKGRF